MIEIILPTVPRSIQHGNPALRRLISRLISQNPGLRLSIIQIYQQNFQRIPPFSKVMLAIATGVIHRYRAIPRRLISRPSSRNSAFLRSNRQSINWDHGNHVFERLIYGGTMRVLQIAGCTLPRVISRLVPCSSRKRVHMTLQHGDASLATSTHIWDDLPGTFIDHS